MYTESNKFEELPPMWATITVAVATLITNWIWGSVFSQVSGMEAFVLMFVCLLGWPLTLAIITLILTFVLKLCEGYAWVRMAIVLCVMGPGIAVYGVPLWSLIVCAIMTIGVGFKIFRAAQDDADLENL